MINFSSQISETRIPLMSKDGLVDIFIGLGIIFAGVLIWTEVVWMIAVFIPAFLPSFQAVHKRVIEPRIGKFITNSNQYQINLKITLYVLLLIGVSVLAEFFVYYFVRELLSWPGIAEL